MFVNDIQFYYRFSPKNVSVPQPGATVPQKIIFLQTVWRYSRLAYLSYRVAYRCIFRYFKNMVELTVTVTNLNKPYRYFLVM
jgi:hypothetical protein